MRLLLVCALLVATGLAQSAPVGAQATDRTNPIIALQEKGLPVFGIAHPAIVPRGAGRGRGDAAAPATPPPPPPAIVLSDVARETVAYCGGGEDPCGLQRIQDSLRIPHQQPSGDGTAYQGRLDGVHHAAAG